MHEGKGCKSVDALDWDSIYYLLYFCTEPSRCFELRFDLERLARVTFDGGVFASGHLAAG